MTPPNNNTEPVEELKQLISALLNEPVFRADFTNSVTAGLVSSNGKLLKLLPDSPTEISTAPKPMVLDTASEALLFVLLAAGNTAGADEIIHATTLKARTILTHITG